MSADNPAFGSALKALRQAKGIQQKEIVTRISQHYSTERSYRRIESGERVPDRNVIIDVLTKGLLETKGEEIDRLLNLAGYEKLNAREDQQLGIERRRPAELPDMNLTEISIARPALDDEFCSDWSWRYIGLVIASVMAAVIIALGARSIPFWFVVLTSAMYAALYSVSVLLETAYQTHAPKASQAATLIFGFMLLSSVVALTFDSRQVSSRSSAGFGVCLAIFLGAAVAQSAAVRNVLSSDSVVAASFHAHTAQSAHFKNTGYFLSVLFFWFLPFHMILVIERDLLADPGDLAKSLNRAVSGSWSRYPPPLWLWMMLAALAGATLLMRGKIVDNLTPHTRRNRYLNLFYTRAFLYFSLSSISLVWYSDSLDRIVRSLASGS